MEDNNLSNNGDGLGETVGQNSGVSDVVVVESDTPMAEAESRCDGTAGSFTNNKKWIKKTKQEMD